MLILLPRLLILALEIYFSRFTTFKSLLSLQVGNGSRFNFWKDHWVGDSSFKLVFPRLYRLSSLYNSLIQNFYNVQDSTYSVDFHLFQNLNDRESSELVVLLGFLDSILLSANPDKMLWSLDPSRLFTCKSYFQFLTLSLNRTSFHLVNLFGSTKLRLRSNLLFGQLC